MDAKRATAVALLVWATASIADTPGTIRDPFATLANAPQPPRSLALVETTLSTSKDDFELRAILWGISPLANISGMIVAEGDRVHNYTVIQLSRKTAVLRQDDDTILLVLEEDS